jgi:predicted acylesterase/phospholipase RssA
LQQGPLVEAISASAAVPLLFGAVEVDGAYCWDGGLSNTLPIDTLCMDERIHTIIVHRIVRHHESHPLRRGCRPGIADAFNVAHQAMVNRLFDIACEKLADSGRRLIFCETQSPKLPFTRRRREHCVALGRATAAAQVPHIAGIIVPPLTLGATVS